MMPIHLLLAWLLLAQPPVAQEESAARALLEEINSLRTMAGAEALVTHSALETVARWRSEEAARRGTPDADSRLLEETTRRLLRARYRSHDWRSGTLMANWEEGLFGRWVELSPHWAGEVLRGDYESIGIGVSTFEERSVFTVLVALSARTMEERHAAPLRDLEWVRGQILVAVNLARREHRRRPLVLDEGLDIAAQAHAEDQLQRAYYAHESPEGETVRERVEKAGAPGFRRVGENIAKGLFDPTEAVRRWLDSSGHRKNILEPRFSRLGVGVAFGENEKGFEVIWVQTFGG